MMGERRNDVRMRSCSLSCDERDLNQSNWNSNTTINAESLQDRSQVNIMIILSSQVVVSIASRIRLGPRSCILNGMKIKGGGVLRGKRGRVERSTYLVPEAHEHCHVIHRDGEVCSV